MMRNMYKKKGIDNPDNLINSVANNQEYGINIIGAWNMLLITIFLSIMTLINFSAIFLSDFISTSNTLRIAIAPAVIATYYSVDYKKRYKTFFDKFNQESQSIKRKYYILSTLTIVLIVVLSILSFKSRF